MTMNAPLISNEGNCNQHKHYDQDDALFVFREIENGEQTLHSVSLSFGTPFTVLDRLHVLILYLSC
jgi:hypothetical protein